MPRRKKRPAKRPPHTSSISGTSKLAATHVENDHGWRIPNTVEEGFEAHNMSLWYLHCALLFATGVLTPSSDYERAEALRCARLYLDRARQCPAPVLP